MSARVYKFGITRDDLDDQWRVSFDLPVKSRVILVDAQMRQDRLPTLWMEVNETYSRQKAVFFVVPTGGEVPLNAVHVGSAVCAEGALVWHVYQSRV